MVGVFVSNTMVSDTDLSRGALQEEYDSVIAQVMPESADVHDRLDEGAYPYTEELETVEGPEGFNWVDA